MAFSSSIYLFSDKTQKALCRWAEIDRFYFFPFGFSRKNAALGPDGVGLTIVSVSATEMFYFYFTIAINFTYKT